MTTNDAASRREAAEDSPNRRRRVERSAKRLKTASSENVYVYIIYV